MLFRIIVSLALSIGFLGNAFATSCMYLENRYLFACDAGSCTAVFRVRDVPSSHACRRLPQVEAIDARAAARAAILLERHGPMVSHGIVELKMTMPYWGGNASDPLNGFEADKKSAVTLINPDASPAAIAKLRDTFEAQTRAQYWDEIVYLSVYWGSSIVGLLALIHSAHMVFKFLYSAAKPRKRAAILLPLAVQLLVGVSAEAVLFSLVIGVFWPGALLVPAVPVLIACEGWTWFLLARAARRARQ